MTTLMTMSITLTDSERSPEWLTLCSSMSIAGQDSGRYRMTIQVRPALVDRLETALEDDDDVISYGHIISDAVLSSLPVALEGGECGYRGAIEDDGEYSGDDVLESLRGALPPGWRADWTGDGNTDAHGRSTSDVIIAYVGVEPPDLSADLTFEIVSVEPAEVPNAFRVEARVFGPRPGINPDTLIDTARADFSGQVTTWYGLARPDGAGCALTCTGWASADQWCDPHMYRELGCAAAVELGERILAEAVVP